MRRIVNNGNPSGCPTSPDPFLASGGGVFTNGTWFTRDHPSAAGAGLASLSASGPSGACVTDPPASDWVCINGGWVPPGHPLAVGATPSTPNPPAPPSPPTGGSSCTTTAPAPGWVCVNGGWVPPGHPLALTAPPPTTPTTPPPPPTPPIGGVIIIPPVPCTTVQPAPTWVCVNGGWLPPNHPLIGSAPTTPTLPAPPPPPPGVCTTPDPFAGIPGLMGVCVGGGWVPVGHPLAGGG